MKCSNILTCLLMVSFASILFSSCEKKEEIIPEPPFEILGTWTFDEVTTTAPILGEFMDNEPEGNITFNEDGTGSAAYTFDVVGVLGTGVPISRNDNFVWVKVGDNVTITSEDDETVVWTISDETESSFTTDWTQAVSGIDAVIVSAQLSK